MSTSLHSSHLFSPHHSSPPLLLHTMSLHRDLFKPLPDVTSIDDFSVAFAARLALNVDSLGPDTPSRHASRSGSVRSPLSRQDSRANTVLAKLVNTNDGSDDGASDASVSDRSASASASAGTIITIPDVLHTLSLSSRSATRSGIGYTEREVLLAHLYRMIISPAWETYMGPYGPTDEDFSRLVALHATTDSRFEWEAWLRCSVGYACVAIDDVASDVVDSLFPLLLSQITPQEPTARMESALWAFMACLLFVYHGAENHGMLHHAAVFAQHADTIGNDAAHDAVHAACLYTVALALSLAWESGREVNGTELIDSVALTLEWKGNSSSKSKVAAAVLAGVLHEVDPSNENGYSGIAQLLEPLANEGARKAGKKGKPAKSVFRDVYNSLRNKATEIDPLTLSKTKTVRVTTWSAYVRLQVLRFVFAAETNAWLSRSREMRAMLKVRCGGDKGGGEDDDELEQADSDDSDIESAHRQQPLDSYGRRALEKERSVKLKKERLDKVSR